MKSRTLELASIVLLAAVLTISYNAAVYAHRVIFDRTNLHDINQAKDRTITLTQNTEQKIGGIKTDTRRPASIDAQTQETQESQADNKPANRKKTRTTINELLKKTSEKKTTSSILLLLLFAFIAGILTSFTPCVYPMIPVTVGVLQAQASHTLKHSVLSAISYVTGIAIVYASLGYLSAKASILFGRWASSPLVIGLMILFFLYLAFSMFDFYDIYIPKFLSHKTEIQTQGSLLKIFVFGMLSGTVASPCLTPALALLLGVAAKQGNPIIGFLTLFLFSIGMGLILVIIGIFSSALSLMPRSGMWLLTMKKAMGFAMLAACVHFMHNNISTNITLALYAIISMNASLYFFIFEKARNIVTYALGTLAGCSALVIIGLIIKNMLR
ncbi:MAG: cytochrome c biogenesis protein CcdA [bacterium]